MSAVSQDARNPAVSRIRLARRAAAAALAAALLAGCSAHRDRVVPLPAVDPSGTSAPEPAIAPPDGTIDREAVPPRNGPRDDLQARERHVVAPGETLWRIARMHGVTLESLARANGIANPARIAVGQALVIPRVSPDPSARRESIGDPGGDGDATAPPARRDAATIGLAWPVRGQVSSEFGAPRGRRVHKGVDILVPDGTPVTAVEEGTVRFAGWRGAYGRLVIVDHPGGLTSYYAHNSALHVRKGERVGRGQAIAASGRSGNATAPHLHFELRVGGTPVDPLRHLAQ